MDFFYVSEDNDEYDVILPFELYYNETVIPFPEKEIFSTDIYNIIGMVVVSESTIGKNEDNALNIFVKLKARYKLITKYINSRKYKKLLNYY